MWNVRSGSYLHLEWSSWTLMGSENKHLHWRESVFLLLTELSTAWCRSYPTDHFSSLELQNPSHKWIFVDLLILRLWSCEKAGRVVSFFYVQKVSLWVHLCTYIAHRTEWLFQHKTPTYMYLRPIRNSQLKTVPSRWGPFLVLQRNWKKPKRNLFSFANRFLFRIEIKIDQAWLFPKSKCRSLI